MIRNLQSVMDDFTRRGEECGCQLAIYQHGEKICSLCSGWMSADKTKPVTTETLFPVFSVGKGVVTTLIHILAEQKLLQYDDLVIRHWPEYGIHGKEATTIRDILSHRAGLYDFPDGCAFHDKFDWQKAVEAMENMAPMDKVGGMHHYHAQTYGLLAGRLAERVSGQDFRTLLRNEILDKLNIHALYFGLPDESMLQNVALIDGSGFPPDSRTKYNSFAVLGGLNPSSNGTANAEALAQIYSSLLPAGCGGIRLLQAVYRKCDVRRTLFRRPRHGAAGNAYLPYAGAGLHRFHAEDLG